MSQQPVTMHLGPLHRNVVALLTLGPVIGTTYEDQVEALSAKLGSGTDRIISVLDDLIRQKIVTNGYIEIRGKERRELCINFDTSIPVEAPVPPPMRRATVVPASMTPLFGGRETQPKTRRRMFEFVRTRVGEMSAAQMTARALMEQLSISRVVYDNLERDMASLGFIIRPRPAIPLRDIRITPLGLAFYSSYARQNPIVATNIPEATPAATTGPSPLPTGSGSVVETKKLQSDINSSDTLIAELIEMLDQERSYRAELIRRLAELQATPVSEQPVESGVTKAAS